MGHCGRLGSLLLLGALTAGTASSAPAPVTAPVSSPVPPIQLPAGIANAAGNTGFFAAVSGIDAIDLATGSMLWQTHEAQRPLLVDGDHLLAQAGVKRNRLRILRLDLTRKGECDLESDPVVFPAWVVTGEAPGHSFSAHWRIDKHQLVLQWEASAWYAGKSKPTPEQETAARKHAAGIARIDLRSGQVEMTPAAPAVVPPPPPLPEQLEKKAVRWQRLIGTHWKVLALEEAAGRQRLVLHTWDRQSEKCLGEKELLRGTRLLTRVTLDDDVLCLRESSPSPDERGSLMPRKTSGWWWLFSAHTGERIGRVPDEPGMHALAVHGKRVFYLLPGTLRGSLAEPSIQPRTLKVLDLSSGKKLWERPVAGKWIAPPPL